MPEYAAFVSGGKRPKKAPRLLQSVPPVAPAGFEPGRVATVIASIAINERGEVDAVRIARSDDPRCDALAVSTISAWRFAPAEDESGHAIKVVVKAPLEFRGTPLANSVTIGVGTPARDARGRSVFIPLSLRGARVHDVKGGRVIVHRVLDDTGTELAGEFVPASFLQVSVGRISDEVLTRVLPPNLSISFKSPPSSVKSLALVEATVELAIPSADPDATVRISDLPARLGTPLEAPALASAGVRLWVLDKARCDALLADPEAAGELREYLAPTPVHPGLPVPKPVAGMTDRDVVLIIQDPDHRVVGHEFQNAFGNPVRYEHNGWSHFQPAEGRRLVIFRLPQGVTDEIQLVCWLVTPKSIARMPLKLTGLPLPQEP